MAFAATAFYTGQSKMVMTTSYKYVWKCQYNLYGKLYRVLMEPGQFCFPTVDIEAELQ